MSLSAIEVKRLQDELEAKDMEIHYLRGTLLDIMAAHANDDVRPKAFYMAANAYKCSIGES